MVRSARRRSDSLSVQRMLYSKNQKILTELPRAKDSLETTVGSGAG